MVIRRLLLFNPTRHIWSADSNKTCGISARGKAGINTIWKPFILWYCNEDRTDWSSAIPGNTYRSSFKWRAELNFLFSSVPFDELCVVTVGLKNYGQGRLF